MARGAMLGCKIFIVLVLAGSLVLGADAQYGGAYGGGYDQGYGEEYYEDLPWYDGNYDGNYTGGYDYGYGDYDNWEDATQDFLEITEPDCSKLPNGKMQLNGTQACDVRVSGMDAVLDKLPGGLDGVYVLADCHLGHPMYRRKGSPAGAGRLLYYNIYYQDWNFIKDIGSEPTGEEEELVYGGSGYGEERPQIVDAVYWRINVDFTSIEGEYPDSLFVEYTSVTVSCDNDMGVNVEFEGKAGPPKHLAPVPQEDADSEIPQPPEIKPGQAKPDKPSQSTTGNDNFYSKHESSGEQPHRHSRRGSIAKWFVWAAVTSGLVAAAFFGLTHLQRRRGGLAASMANGSLGRFPQASMDMGVMGESGAARGGGYEPPSAENTSLLNPEPEDMEDAVDLEEQT